MEIKTLNILESKSKTTTKNSCSDLNCNVEISIVDAGNRKMNVSKEAWEAFKFYQEFEDWASETEKTDYTYSPLSRFKKEVCGLPVRPNLSRSPLRSSRKGYVISEERRQNLINQLNASYEFGRNSSDSNGAASEYLDDTPQISVSIFRKIFTVAFRIVSYFFTAIIYSLHAVFTYLKDKGTTVLSTCKSVSVQSVRWFSRILVEFSAVFVSTTRQTQQERSYIETIKTKVINILTVVKTFARETTREKNWKFWLLFLILPLLLSGCWFYEANKLQEAKTYAITAAQRGWILSESVLRTLCNSVCASVNSLISNLLSFQLPYFIAISNQTENHFDIREITKRIKQFENELNMERQKREEFAEKLGVSLNDVRKSLQIYKIDATRCCKRTFPPPMASYKKLAESNFVGKIDEDALQSRIDDLNNRLANLAKEASVMPENAASEVDLEEVRRLVTESIQKYDADKTGLPDHALESAGARVVSIRCTKTYKDRKNTAFGIPLYSTATSEPEDALRPGMIPGQCWAFEGSIGSLVIELPYFLLVSGFSVEHIPKTINPNGRIDSAPQHFSVWGLKDVNDMDQFLFGEYRYLESGPPLQFFEVQTKAEELFKFIELKIVSNYGHPLFTCLYRFRVHGSV